MTATENPAPPSYDEAILQRKLSKSAIREENVVVNNASDDIIQLSSPSKDENDKSKQEMIMNSNEQIDHKNGNSVTVGRVLLIGLLLIVSPWCACKMMKDTSRSTNRNNCRTRGSCCGIDQMERQRLRGERRIERKTEKVDRKEAKDKLCDRKRERYETKIQKWENKIEQRQEMINSRCRAAHPKVVTC